MQVICLWLIAAFVVPGVDDISSEASKRDLEKMQGDWVAVAYTVDGNALPEDDVQSFFRTIKANQYTVSRYRKVIGKGTIKLDATRSPKTIDAFPANASAGSKPILGIYSLEGSRLKMCFAAPGKDRPTELRSVEDSGNVLTEWEPEKNNHAG